MMQLLKYFWFKKVSGLFILPINKLWKFEFFVCMHSLAIRTVFEKLPLMMSNIRVGRGVHQNSSKMAKKHGTLLKYGFCKKLLWYKWTYDQSNTFFLTFWLVTQQTSQKERKKVCNWSEIHLYRSNFLQNPYFNRHSPVAFI